MKALIYCCSNVLVVVMEIVRGESEKRKRQRDALTPAVSGMALLPSKEFKVAVRDGCDAERNRVREQELRRGRMFLKRIAYVVGCLKHVRLVGLRYVAILGGSVRRKRTDK